MTEEEKIKLTAETSAKQRSLELLFDYTKFHIGLYLTLTTSYVGIATAKLDGKPIFPLHEGFLWPIVLAFTIAGLAGGVIASSITQSSARSSAEFLSHPIGPWEIKMLHFRAKTWTWLEHTSFWIGLILAVFSFKR